MHIHDLYGKRADTIKEARRLYESAEEAKREPTAEEREQFDRLMSRAQDMGRDIERLRALEAEEARAAAAAATVTVGSREGTGQPESQPRATGIASPEYRQAFEAWFRKRPYDVRALEIGTTSEGGYMVPTDFEARIVEVARDASPMRGVSTVYNWPNDRQIPLITGHASATWVDEEGEFQDTTPTFDQLTIAALKAGALMKVSDELLSDSAIPVGDVVASQIGGAIGTLENTAYTVGNGSTQPQGVVGRAAAGVTAASATAIAADELLSLFHSVKSTYRTNGTFMMEDATLLHISKLKDSTGQYLLQPGLQGGPAYTIRGRPVVTNEDMATIATAAVTVLFGDFRVFWIVDRGGFVLRRLVERYAELGQVGFIGFRRSDSNLMLTEAVKKLTQA